MEGESGILAISHPDFRPKYEPSKRRLTWPNGSMATTYSADEPNLLRGPQHHFAWADELASWRYFDAWDQLQFGLRLGKVPRVVVTTTPRPLRVIRELVKASSTHVTRGSTYANADNLAPAFLERILTKYKGTTLGRQELDAELLDESPGALWKRIDIDGSRVKERAVMRRIVVAVDPAVTAHDDSDETGIIMAGLGDDKHYYVLADGSGIMSPDKWARKAVAMYEDNSCDRLVAEVNQGGDLVEMTIRGVSDKVAYKAVRASRGKVVRAEPIAALYEQGRVHHVGLFPDLEDQLVNYVPGLTSKSPDRLDALVWAITALHHRPTLISSPADTTGPSRWRP